MGSNYQNKATDQHGVSRMISEFKYQKKSVWRYQKKILNDKVPQETEEKATEVIEKKNTKKLWQTPGTILDVLPNNCLVYQSQYVWLDYVAGAFARL